MNKLILKEIIWEITGRCENGCKYCGSKDVWNNEIVNERIKRIAYEISLYPPEEIDISGGDPLLIDYDIHKYVVDTLKAKGVKCKILSNTKSMRKNTNYPEIFSLYDWKGISVNSQEDIDYIYSHLASAEHFFVPSFYKSVTYITNFNVENIFLFDKIKPLVEKVGAPWMVQFTIYKDKDNNLAIYNNPDAFKFLRDKINNSNVRIIPSDNINDNECSAGINSLGILDSGEVIPCLSMRSWKNDDIIIESQGNILNEPLEKIWTERFLKQRFSKECKCCKDWCNNKSVGPIQNFIKNLNDMNKDIIDKDATFKNPSVYIKNPDVFTPSTYVYAVVTSRTILNTYSKDTTDDIR